MRIRISWQSDAVTATLDQTPTALALAKALPLTATASTWGDEVYFSTPVRASLESDARQVVDPGSVCFWVQGNALALPFGPTPISQANECRLVTKVNVLGRIEGDSGRLASVHDGDEIRVELVC